MGGPLALLLAAAVLVVGVVLLVRSGAAGGRTDADRRAGSAPPSESASLREPLPEPTRLAAADPRAELATPTAAPEADAPAAAAPDLLLIDDAAWRERFERLTIVPLAATAGVPEHVPAATGGTLVGRVVLERASLESALGGFAFERPAGLVGRVAFQLEPLGLSLLADVAPSVPLRLRVPLPTTATIDVVDGAGEPREVPTVLPSQVFRADGTPLAGAVPPAAWPTPATSLAPGSPMVIPVVPSGRLCLSVIEQRVRPPMREGFFDLALGLHHVWVLDELRPLRVVGFAGGACSVERLHGRREPVAALSHAGTELRPSRPRAGAPMPPAPPGTTLWIPANGIVALVLDAGTPNERRIPLAHDATEVRVGP